MQTTVTSKSLALALDRVAPAISAKSSIPILECVCIKVEGNLMELTGTNLDYQITATMECETKTSGSFCVAFQKLSKAVKVMGGSIDMSLKKGSLSMLSKPHTSRSLPCLDAKEFQALEGDLGDEDYEIEDLISAINNVQHSACSDATKINLNSVIFEENEIFATDGRVISTYKTNSKINSIVPIELVRALLKTKPETMRVSLGKNLIRFDSGDIVVVGKTLEGTTPNWRSQLQRQLDIKHEFCINREELISVLGKGGMADDSIAALNVNPSFIRIESGRGEDVAADQTSVNNAFEMTVGINPQYLNRVLQSSSENLVYIGSNAKDPFDPLVIRAGKATHIMMPKRLPQ